MSPLRTSSRCSSSRGRHDAGRHLKVTDLSNYRGRRILETADADHPRKLDESIVEWLNQNGAKADFIYLGDRGIVGNGHMMMLENNSDTPYRFLDGERLSAQVDPSDLFIMATFHY